MFPSDHWQRELATAIEQRDKARNDALEDAAKICEQYANVGVVGARICAAAICATKEFGAHMKEMHEFIAENQRLIAAIEQRVGPNPSDKYEQIKDIKHLNPVEIEAMVLKHEQQIKDLATHLLELKQTSSSQQHPEPAPPG